MNSALHEYDDGDDLAALYYANDLEEFEAWRQESAAKLAPIDMQAALARLDITGLSPTLTPIKTIDKVRKGESVVIIGVADKITAKTLILRDDTGSIVCLIDWLSARPSGHVPGTALCNPGNGAGVVALCPTVSGEGAQAHRRHGRLDEKARRLGDEIGGRV